MRRPVVLALVGGAVVVLLLAVVALLAGLRLPWRGEETAFTRALAHAPADAQRLSWTDWGGVRREVGSDVDARSSVADVRRFLDAGYDADLTSRSALVESAASLQTRLGISPASVAWELFSQSDEGAVVTLGLPDDSDVDALADRLADAGYPRPESASGVWAGGPDLAARLGLTPELSYVVLDRDHRLVLASDQEAYVETAAEAAAGDADGVAGLDAVGEALVGSGDVLSAAVYTGDYACGALAMGRADPRDQAQADELVSAAGTVDPYSAFAMGVLAGGRVRVAMEFADDEQARANADSRAALASGAAVGQGGSFADRFTLVSARADGPLVTLDLDPVHGQYVLSDLSTGPLLFATC